MGIIKDIFKVFNGNTWDEHYFRTSSEQVVHTKADGTATTVQAELLAQNSAMGNYLPLSGGTLSGNVIVGNDSRTVASRYAAKNAYGYVALEMSSAGNMGLYDHTNGAWIVQKNSAGETTINNAKRLVLNNKGTIEVSDTTPTWLTLLSGTNGVNVKAYGNTSTWRPIAASAFNQNSSRLIKENIKDISEGEAAKVLQLRPVSFDFRKEVGGQKDRVGLIAEEVLDVFPGSVTVPEGYNADTFDIKRDMPLMVDYVSLIPYLIKIVQDQQKEIEGLKLLINEQCLNHCWHKISILHHNQSLVDTVAPLACT